MTIAIECEAACWIVFEYEQGDPVSIEADDRADAVRFLDAIGFTYGTQDRKWFRFDWEPAVSRAVRVLAVVHSAEG